MLRNLLSNAIKYTGKGGAVNIRVRQENGHATFQVEDTGIGMDPDEVPRLLEPFRQATSGLDREYEGVGLGLSVTRLTVDQMGGSLSVDTAKGEGTCFTVQLPQL